MTVVLVVILLHPTDMKLSWMLQFHNKQALALQVENLLHPKHKYLY